VREKVADARRQHTHRQHRALGVQARDVLRPNDTGERREEKEVRRGGRAGTECVLVCELVCFCVCFVGVCVCALCVYIVLSIALSAGIPGLRARGGVHEESDDILGVPAALRQQLGRLTHRLPSHHTTV
jgi:hypothetical protein